MENSDPVLDHVGLWCTELEASAKRFEDLTGIASVTGGRHHGQGTWNRLAGAGEGLYVELLARDPAQSVRGPLAEAAEGLPDLAPCLIAYRADDLEGLATRALKAGFTTPGPFAMQRQNAAGETLAWRILFVRHRDHPLLPFFIDWQDTPHPSQALGSGVSVSDIWLETRVPDPLARSLEGLGVKIATRYGEDNRLHMTLEGPAGRLES